MIIRVAAVSAHSIKKHRLWNTQKKPTHFCVGFQPRNPVLPSLDIFIKHLLSDVLVNQLSCEFLLSFLYRP